MITRSIRLRSALYAALSAAGLGIALGGVASASEPPSITIHYSDLDLSQPKDAQVLYRRLRRAAAIVCGWTYSADLSAYLDGQRCYSEALQRAVSQVRSPQLLALYRGDSSHLGRGG
jgi:UrcA family protein